MAVQRASKSKGEGVAAASISEASEVVHQRSRLAIMTVLYEAGQADFTEIRGVTKLSDGNLSRHLQVLEEAQLVTVKKGFLGKRPRTVIRLTTKGVSAYEDEIRILRNIVSNADAARGVATGKRAAREHNLGW